MTTIHASAVALGLRGILLLGAPGSGKSGLALALVARGAMLVADDQVQLTISDEVLLASPALALAGLIEVRGVGIRRLPWRRRVRLVMALDLDAAPERLPSAPEAWARRAFLGINLPILPLAAHEPLAALKAEAALAALEGR